MTDNDLTTLLRTHVADTEPPSTLDVQRSINAGRRTLVRRRGRRGLAAVALLGAAAVAVPALLNHDVLPAGDRGRLDPLTVTALKNYDASAMPRTLADATDPILRSSAPDIASSGVFRADDEQGVELPEKYWDKASGMELDYGGTGDHRFHVSLMHSRSEAEGNARKNCENDVRLGYAFSCDVTEVNGDIVTTSVMAVRKMDGPARSTDWGSVTRSELRTGDILPGDPSQRPIDPDEIYFLRSTESVHSATFLTVAEETVKAPTYGAALKEFVVPVAGQVDLVTNPTLVIPKPPIGANGCGWQLHPENMSCGIRVP
jgi:hypothetical protein